MTDIRDKYYDLTGDYYGAYGRENADEERFAYSEDSIQRAVNSLNEADPMGEFGFLVDRMKQFGPRAGSNMTSLYQLTPNAGEAAFENSLSDFRQARAREDSGKYMDMLDAAGGILGSLLTPKGARQIGAIRGLIDELQYYED